MASENFGLKIGLEGEKEFKSQLNEINQSFKVLGSEMKLVDSQFEKNDQSVDALTARNTVLEKSIDSQKAKIETLRSALKNASDSFGENDKRTQNWQIQLNNAQAELNKMEKELDSNTKALDETDKALNKASKGADEFGDEVKDAGKESDEASNKFEALGDVCKAVGVTLAAAVTAVAAAAVKCGKALVDMATEGAAYADTVLTESTVTGIATDKLQEYMYAAELVDVSTETLTKSMAKQIKSMKSVQDGSNTMVEAYEKLGVEVMNADGTLRDSDDVYWEVIDALGKVENETERDAIAMTILGKSAQELNPLITAGAERMKELGEQAQEAGYVLSDELLNDYGALDDQIQYLTNGCTAAKNALGTILLPVLTELAADGVSLLSEFTNGIKKANGDVNKIADVFGSILPKAMKAIMKYVPALLKMIGNVVISLGQAITDNIDILVDSATEIIMTFLDALIAGLPQIASGALKLVSALAGGIIENLPLILQAVIEVVALIANGIGDSLPTLIPALVGVITQLCKTIISNLPLLLDAVLNVIKGLAKGMLDAIPIIIDALPEIITSIIDFILGAIPEIIDTGIELLTSLVDALPTIISSIVEAIPQIIDGIIGAIVEALPLIIDAGIRLFVAIIQALPEIIETILTAIPTIISSIINALIDNLPLLINAGIQLFTAIVSNLPVIIQEIVKAIPQILSAIVSGFASGFGQMADVGKNLVKGLWEGIKSLSSWIWDQVSGWANDLWTGIKNFFGIHSPSKKMAWIGEMMVEGMSKGIDEDDSAYKSVKKLDENIEGLMEDIGANKTIDIETNVKEDDSIRSSIKKLFENVALNVSGIVTDNKFKGLEGFNSENIVEVSVPLYLDGELITSSTSKIQSGRTVALKRALGVI